MMTQRQHLDLASRRIAEATETFLFMINDPTAPLTADELEQLIERRPWPWACFKNWVPVLRAREQGGTR